MSAGLPKAPGLGGVKLPSSRNASVGKTQAPITAQPKRMPRMAASRRDYSKPAIGAENPLGSDRTPGFGQLGMTGET